MDSKQKGKTYLDQYVIDYFAENGAHKGKKTQGEVQQELENERIQGDIERRKTLLNERDKSLTSLHINYHDMCVAFSDLTELFDKNTGEPLRPHKFPTHIRAAVQEATIVEHLDSEGNGKIVYKYKLYTKDKAIERLKNDLGANKIEDSFDQWMKDAGMPTDE